LRQITKILAFVKKNFFRSPGSPEEYEKLTVTNYSKRQTLKKHAAFFVSAYACFLPVIFNLQLKPEREFLRAFFVRC